MNSAGVYERSKVYCSRVLKIVKKDPVVTLRAVLRDLLHHQYVVYTRIQILCREDGIVVVPANCDVRIRKIGYVRVVECDRQIRPDKRLAEDGVHVHCSPCNGSSVQTQAI